MKQLFVALLALGLFGVTHTGGNAELLDGPDAIPAPPSVEDLSPGAENLGQQAFDERQCVTLTAPLAVDDGELPAGTVVDSHMVFLNPVDGVLLDTTETWTFVTPIIATMSDAGGELEAASNAVLGAPGTTYPDAFLARGLESGDSFTVDGNTLEMTMLASAPGDWMRVVTEPACAQSVLWGDNNCSTAVDPVDSLLVLRGDAGLPTNTGDCPNMGQDIEILNASPHIWGDIDCTGAMTPVDALKILRYDAGLSVSREEGCPDIGSVVTISES